MRLQALQVRFGKTRTGAPLACFDNFPGYDAELTPAQMRALAATLTRIADECEQLQLPLAFSQLIRDYPVAE